MNTLRIGLFMNLRKMKGRQLLIGIHEELARWPDVQTEDIPYHLRLWGDDPFGGLDGALAELDKYDQARPFWELPIPVINISDALPTVRFPKSIMEDARIGLMAAGHLLERGYEHFICLGSDGHVAAERRTRAFMDYLCQKGHSPTYLQGWFGPDNVLADALRRELQSVNVATGVFAWNDTFGLNAVRIAQSAGKRIPEQVGVIGAGNDDLLTAISPVPLSSIQMNWKSVGRAAVQMLAQALAGEPVTDAQSDQCELVMRASTERYPVSDSRIARCLALIERDLAGDLSIPTLARRVGCSRSSLEAHFKRELGQTTARYILERRIKRARRLLRETTLPIYEIATASGFEDANYFAAAFKRVTGTSPSKYRDAATESSEN
jgi:LacI family transcriptional regulator